VATAVFSAKSPESRRVAPTSCAAGVELTHEERAGQAKLLADLVTGRRAHEGRDDEQADGEHDGEQPDEHGDQATAEAPETQRLHHPVTRYAHRAWGSSIGGVGGRLLRAAI
jgi:hypothetical protein